MATEQREERGPRRGGTSEGGRAPRPVGRAACLGLVLVAACGVERERGYPLYPASDPAPTRAEVAVLTGYVRTVDGVDVSRYGSTFRLLPGCHVVGTPRAWAHTESTQGAVVVKTGEVSFALPMRAGYTYVVEVDVEPLRTVSGGARLIASERSPEGAVTRQFSPLGASPGAASCPAEAPARGQPRG